MHKYCGNTHKTFTSSSQAKYHHGMRVDRNEFSPLLRELLPTNSCQERENQLSDRLNTLQGQPHTQGYLSCTNWIPGVNKQKSKQEVGWWGGYVWEKLGEGCDYDQHILHKIVKETIKISKTRNKTFTFLKVTILSVS